MKKNWNWLEEKERGDFVSPHCLSNDTALIELCTSVIKAAEAAWDMYCSVILLNTIDNTLHTAAAPSLPLFYTQAVDGLAIGPEVGCCGSAAYTKQLVVVEDIQKHPFWSGFTDIAKAANLAACWSMPIINVEGQVLGTFACYFSQVQKPSAKQLEYMDGASRTLAVAIEQHRIQRVISRLSHNDTLTGLRNRSAFRSSLQEQLDTGEPIALLFVDLDNFKEVNDSLGHEAGDQVIRAIGQKFRELESDDYIFSRIGGDEFTVIHKKINDKKQLRDFSEQLIDIINLPLEFNGHTIQVGASIGIALYPEHGVGISELMKHADTAMYHAKSAGRNCCWFFDEILKQALLEKIELQQSLRSAFDLRQFEISYQPQVDNYNAQLISVEALVYWKHPVKGYIAATDFIDSMESIGLTKIVDLWVIESSCELIGSLPGEFSLAINLSASYLSRECFPERVESILKRTGFPAHRLVFEVIGRTLKSDIGFVLPVMEKLKALGLRFSIDDSGNGYSSLNYLKALPIDEVKIDKSFVAGLEHDRVDRIICQNLCALAEELQLHVVALGVDKQSQKQILEEIGCKAIQGDLVSLPINIEELQTFIGNKAYCSI